MVGAGDKKEKGAVGKAGEDAAVHWLEAKGFIIRDRNWRSHHREIDIIAESPQAVHIVEVKTRSLPEFCRSAPLDIASETLDPASAVDSRKQSRLVAAANHYIALNHITKEVQFDIVAVILYPDGSPSIEYIPAAFFPITFGR